MVGFSRIAMRCSLLTTDHAISAWLHPLSQPDASPKKAFFKSHHGDGPFSNRPNHDVKLLKDHRTYTERLVPDHRNVHQVEAESNVVKVVVLEAEEVYSNAECEAAIC